MKTNVAWIGFGEAAAAFAEGLRLPRMAAFDCKTDAAATRPGKLAEYARSGASAAQSAQEAVADADTIFSLVTADQALAAAHGAAPHIRAGTFWFDMNSVTPGAKRAANHVIAASGGRYMDVAVMAPVLPMRAAVPLLVSGDSAEEAAAILSELGFANVSTMPGGVGAASAVKMIRSVMVKGIEALSAECVLAAEAAGVREAVIASLDTSWPGADWGRRFDYNLDRMMVHGVRRAAEMDEAITTLEALGIVATLTRGTADGQRAIGRLHITPPDGLEAKLDTLRPFTRSIEGCAA